MKIGSTDIVDCKIGTTQVNKIYLGNNLVWEKASPLLLDLYPNAAAAYSLRKLRTAYAGDAIRVRRSSDDTEMDIGFVDNELDTASLLNFVGAGDGFVSTWYDQSLNANNFIQPTASNQPEIIKNGFIYYINGNVGIFSNQYNLSHQMYTVNTGIINQVETSYFAVTSNYTIENTGVLFSTNYSSNTNAYRCLVDTRSTPNRNFVITVDGLNYFANLSTPRVNNNQVLLTGIVDSLKNMSSFANGAVGSTDTFSGTFTSDLLFFTPTQINTVLELRTITSEMIFYNSDQSTNRTAIESNINSHYTIY